MGQKNIKEKLENIFMWMMMKNKHVSICEV